MTVLIRYCIKNHNQKLSGCPVCHQILLDIDVAFSFFVLFMHLKKPCYQLCESTITSTFLSCFKTVMVWVNGSRITELTKYTFCLSLHTLEVPLCCRPSRVDAWLLSHLMLFNSPTTRSSHDSTLNFESCLFLSVLFSGLLLNFTVVSLPLPEYSLQCFYSPPPPHPVVCFSSAGTVLSRLNGWQGKTYWKKGHFVFISM